MFVARVDTIELVEDFLDILFLNTLTCIANGKAEMLVLVVPRAQIDVNVRQKERGVQA